MEAGTPAAGASPATRASSSPLTLPPSSLSTSPQDNLPPPPPILPEDHQPSPRPTLVQVRARALMYLNHSGYKLQCHPLPHLSDILMIEELELEDLCRICGLEISRSGDTKAFAPKQTTFSLPTPLSNSGIYISREIER